MCTSLQNIVKGPEQFCFLSRPKIDNSLYVIPMSTSSNCANCPACNGSNSAVGGASRILLKADIPCLRLKFKNDRIFTILTFEFVSM